MELWGNLKDFSLPDVIQLVGFGRKTGVLSVEYGGVGSMLYFSGGNVIHAVSGAVEGEEAVYDLFHLEEGQFRFQAEVEPPHRTIFMDPTNLVMEAARLLDESSRGSTDREKIKTVAEAVREELPAAAELDDSSLFGSAADNDIKEAEVKTETPAITPAEARKRICELLERRYGKDSKRLTQAVEKCGDSTSEFMELSIRVERFVSAFVDSKSAPAVGNEIRQIIELLPG